MRITEETPTRYFYERIATGREDARAFIASRPLPPSAEACAYLYTHAREKVINDDTAAAIRTLKSLNLTHRN
jgi:uncharacterized protein (DUF2236 family)